MKPVESKIVGSIAVCIGGVILYFLVFLPWRKAEDAKGWTEVPIKIISSSMRESSSPDGPSSYHPEILYTYTFENQTYESNSYYFGSFGGSEDRVRSIIKELPPGKEAVAFVNPLNPKEAVLKKGVAVSILSTVVGLGFLLFGVCFTFLGNDKAV